MNNYLWYALLALCVFVVAACGGPAKAQGTPYYVASSVGTSHALAQLAAAMDGVAATLDGRTGCAKNRGHRHQLLQDMQHLYNFAQAMANAAPGQAVYAMPAAGLDGLYILGRATYRQALKAVTPHWNALPQTTQAQLLAYGRQAEALDTSMQKLLAAPNGAGVGSVVAGAVTLGANVSQLLF